MTFDQLLEKAHKLTDINDHTRARILIAEYYNLRNYVKILKYIEAIHEEQGQLNYHLFIFRTDLTNEMLASICRQVKNAKIINKLMAVL